MQFSLTIDTANSAFDDGAEGCFELSRILGELAGKLEESTSPEQLDGSRLRDSNGNTVGHINVHEVAAVAEP